MHLTGLLYLHGTPLEREADSSVRPLSTLRQLLARGVKLDTCVALPAVRT